MMTPDENRIVNEVLKKVKPLVKTFRPARVTDNQDPQMLGRIRCVPEQINEQDLQNSVYKFNPKTDKWTEKDPFVYLPFLPYFIYQTPKPDEYVQLITFKVRFHHQQQYIGKITIQPKHFLIQE
jgi:hypothetical protein